MSLGLLPWLAEDGLQRVRATQASIEYLLAVNRFSAGVNKQVKSLLDYLLFGSEQNLLFFTDYGKETKSAIEACARAANRRASVEPTKKAALLDEVVTIEHGYGQITALADKAIRLKRAGQGRQALELVADGLDPLLDTGLIPKITLALDEGGQEILALSRTASRRGAAIVAVVSLLILAGTLHLIHGMLGSLEKLRTGIGVIGEGNLEYRIDLDTRDEFGVLAASFNDMVARLQQSRTALDRLNADLEKRVEERTDQLRTANRELETFSYSVSHDLRSPLARIQALCQILQDPDDPDLSGEAAESIERIAQATEDMDQLIAALLSLSQVASGEMNRRPVDLSAMARTLVEELRQREPERSTTIRIAPDVVVDGDPSLLLVAMANLLGNAWKFTARTSRPKIEFGALPADGSRTFFVRDNGAGFDMEQAEKIFSPFRRLHEEEEFKGTGIGLATVQRIIHRHGGRIWAEGEIGRGATFLFTLGPPPGTNRS
jgi:signal transduction histidine kinase